MESGTGGLLSTGVVVTGGLFSQGPMTIAGSVTGDVTCKGQLYITGHVVGKITAPAVEITGSVEGDITVLGTLRILACAEVKGDVTAGAATVAGRLCGNLSAVESATLTGQARVTGDIETEVLSVEETVAVVGYLSVGRSRVAESETQAAFEARLRACFPAPDAADPPQGGGPDEEGEPSYDEAYEARRLKLKTAADKLKAQKGKGK